MAYANPGGESWLTPFSYRKYHNMTGSSGAGSNYQIKIYVHYGSGSDSGDDVYLNSKCQSDFDDIRFTDDDGITELDYWIEDFTDGVIGEFWVEVQDNLDSNQQIYVYYGEASASNNSDGESTFLLFDHFESWDTSKWERDHSEYGQDQVSDSQLKIGGASGFASPTLYRVIQSKESFGTDTALRFLMTQWDEPVNHGTIHGYADDGKSWTNASGNMEHSLSYGYVAGNDSGHSSVSVNHQQDNAINEYQRRGTSSCYFWEREGAYTFTKTDYVPTGDLPIQLGVAIGYTDSAGAVEQLFIDWIFVRNYNNPEPTHGGWGSEESHPAITTNSLSVTNLDLGEWIFTDSKTYIFRGNYTHDTSYLNISHVQIRFNDTFHTIHVGYNRANDTFYIVNGSDHFSLRESYCSASGSGTNLIVDWGIYLLGTVLDALEVDIYGWSNHTDGFITPWATFTDDFNIYSVGGLAEYDFSGSSGHTTGGDAWEIWAGGTDHPADLFDDDFEGSEWLDHWTRVPDKGTISLTTDLYHGSPPDSYQSACLETGTASGENPRIYGWFREVSSGMLYFDGYIYTDQVVKGYSQLWFYNDQNSFIFHIDFGDSTDPDRLHATNSSSIIDTGYDFSELTWNDITIDINFTSYQYNFTFDGNPFGPYYFTNNHEATNFMFLNFYIAPTQKCIWIDDIRLWIEDPGGYSGSGEVTVLWKWLQGMRFQWAWGISPDGDGSIIGNHSEAGFIEFGIDYMDPSSYIWINNTWKCRITIIGSALGSSDNWIRLNCSWYERDGSLISSDILYSYWEGLDGDRDYFRVYTDLWFNKINASSLGGGRVNSYFFGMHDGSNPWLRWFLGTDWGPMMEDVTESFVFWNLEDNNGDLIPARILTLMRVRINVTRTSSYGYSYVLRDFEVVDPVLAKGSMEGIQTPTPEKTKTINLNQGGILSGLWTLFQSLGGIFYTQGLIPFGNYILNYLLQPMIDAYNLAQFLFVNTVILGLDTLIYALFPSLGASAFSGFLTALSTFFGYIGNFFTWMGQIIPIAIDMLSQTMLFIVTAFTQIIYIFIQVVTYFVEFWNILTGLFTGAYGVGVNIWTEWGGSSWVLLGAILYPMFLMERCVQYGSFEPLINHLGHWKNIFAFVIMVFKAVGEFTINIIFRIIEAIPVAE